MEEPSQRRVELRERRGFILGSLSLGHGISHLYDQGLPAIMPTIASAMGLSNLQVAGLHGVRQASSGVVGIGGGPFVDMLKHQWGLILTGCMFWAAVSFSVVGASPGFPVLVVAMIFVSIPGSLWHLPASAALSQRFPDRRGFAVSMHGFGSNIGNALGPQLAQVLLRFVPWRRIFFIYAGPALVMAAFVWWSLKHVGREAEQEESKGLGLQVHYAVAMIKNPVMLALMVTALLRGIGLGALFNWTPFYLENELELGHIRTGLYLSLLTGTGIVSAPVLGALSDRFGRKMVLVPGLIVATVLSMVVVSTGDSILLPLVLAGMGLFSLALHQIIQAAVLDVVGRGTEATATGLLFGLHGLFGGATPFLAAVIISHLGGYGSIFYYTGILTMLAAVIMIFTPLQNLQSVRPAGR